MALTFNHINKVPCAWIVPDLLNNFTCVCVLHLQLASSISNNSNPTSSIVEEIVMATPDGSSIVSTAVDASDGNFVSENTSTIKKDGKLSVDKDEHNVNRKKVKLTEIVDVHQSPDKSSDGSSSTTSSTWSVKMSPIKKRFSLTNRTKRITSVVAAPNVSLETEGIVIEKTKKDKEKEEVLPIEKDILAMYCLCLECILSKFYRYSIFCFIFLPCLIVLFSFALVCVMFLCFY